MADQVKVLSYDPLEIKVMNKAGIVLPNTGGIGTTAIWLIGTFIIAVSTLLYGYCVKKKEKGGA